MNIERTFELKILIPQFSRSFFDVPRNPENAAVATRVFQFVQAGKTPENLKDSLCVMGNPPGHPRNKAPMKGPWWFFHPLIKPYFLWGRGRVAFLVAQHLRNEDKLKR